jgi:sec-independent protein translocase protein TatC
MYQLSYHFLEIRLRVLYSLLSLILTLATSYYYQFEILYIIGRPFLELDQKFILIDLTEAFYTILRVCGTISFLLVIPFFLYHFWSFYIPSRYNFERKSINKFTLVFCFMIFLELLILYFVIFPKICVFLLSFQVVPSNNSLNDLHGSKLTNWILNKQSHFPSFFPIQIENEIENDTLISIKKTPVLIELTARLESYVNLSTRFYLTVLMIFQIPLLIIMFYYYNIIDCFILCKIRKFFLFSSVLLSAFISPPDIISQSIIAVLLFFLYELLVFVGIFHSLYQTSKE